MSELQKKIYKMMQIFFQENEGNKINRWLLSSCLNEMNAIFIEEAEKKKNSEPSSKKEVKNGS